MNMMTTSKHLTTRVDFTNSYLRLFLIAQQNFLLMQQEESTKVPKRNLRKVDPNKH